jgi:hypothetical protein
LTDQRGLLLGYTLVPANEKEYEPLADLLTGRPAEVVNCRQGPLGSPLPGTARRRRDPAATPDRTRTAANSGRERALASLRL